MFYILITQIELAELVELLLDDVVTSELDPPTEINVLTVEAEEIMETHDEL